MLTTQTELTISPAKRQIAKHVRQSRFDRSAIMTAANAAYRDAKAAYADLVTKAEADMQTSIKQDIAWGYSVTGADIARKRAFHINTIIHRKPTFGACQRKAWSDGRTPIISHDARIIAGVAAFGNE